PDGSSTGLSPDERHPPNPHRASRHDRGLPITWTAVSSLSFFADAAPWLDTRLALGPMPQEVMSTTQWAHAGTALALWMLLPLLIGIWRITRREVAS
ncbi:MAG TPA: hypothetical protein VN213_03490, partial [Solirubrobacteraceae bacterium]|nr:hypothetical protein [Solirubrobacteraceae bacterium]